MGLRILSAAEVESLLDLETAHRSQVEAFTALGDGSGILAVKQHVAGPDGAVAIGYTARVSPDSGAVSKFVGMNPANVDRGLPVISAAITLLDAKTGRPVAVLNGTPITTIRTAAGSAVAVDALAPAGAGDLAVLGAGTQGIAHVRAIAAVRRLRRVRLWRRSAEDCVRIAAELSAELDLDVQAVVRPEDAVAGADLVATCTLSETPVMRGEWLAAGATVVSVGSFEPRRQEIDAAVLDRSAAVVVDDVETAVRYAGPIVSALDEGRLTESDLLSLGEVLTSAKLARRRDEDIIFYNSVGLGIQDAAAAWAVVRRAETADLGTVVPF